MKFSCEKYLIQQAVTIASRSTASKSPIPALEGLLVQVGQDVKITGYDLKKGIYTSFPADVAEPGSIVLNARLFGEIVRSLPDGIVQISTDGMKTLIHCGASDFTVIGSDSSEYPELPAVDRQDAVSIPQDILGKMIRQTIFAVSDNESRPIYTGELFELSQGTLSIVAVDGYRLALRRETIEGGEDCSFIVPGSALSDVEKLCADKDEPAEITVGTKHISFLIGDTVLVSRRLEGEFLNYKKSIPTQFGIEAKMERGEFMRAVGRVSLVIDEKTKMPIRLTLSEDAVDLSCRTGIGNADDRCEAVMTGTGGFTIGFNNRYLLDALKAAPSEEIRLGLNTASSPAVILPADGSDAFAYMILPVRLRAGE